MRSHSSIRLVSPVKTRNSWNRATSCFLFFFFLAFFVFQMAVQVCTADDILWNSFFSCRNYYIHEEITTPMTALIYKWATIDVKPFLIQKLRFLKTNLRAYDLWSLKKCMRPAQKRGKYITQRRLHGFCDLSLEWTYILPITVKLVLFQVNLFLQSGYLIRSRSKFSNHWMTGNWKFLWKFNKLREPTQSKLLYVDEEPQSDLEVIHKSHF